MENEYWNKFYEGESLNLSFPSQFCLFVIQELIESDVKNIFEIGCGNGRDLIFFERYFDNAHGIDASSSAVNSLNMKKKGIASCVDINDKSFIQLLKKLDITKSTAIYSRFFLHAISYKEIENLLTNIYKNADRGVKLFFEFRIEDDSSGKRVTKDHFRNYIDVEIFDKLLGDMFEILYVVSGKGLAKYKKDDAFVSRYILEVK